MAQSTADAPPAHRGDIRGGLSRHSRMRSSSNIRWDAIVPKSAFSGRGYRIMSLDDLGCACRGTVFRTRPAPSEMPWLGLLDELFGR